jgi:hypothetical protein
VKQGRADDSELLARESRATSGSLHQKARLNGGLFYV